MKGRVCGWRAALLGVVTLLGMACGAPGTPPRSGGPVEAAPAPLSRVRFVPQVGHASGVRWLALRPDGVTAVSAGNDATVKLWSVPDAALLRTFSVPGLIREVALGGDGRTVVVGTVDGGVYLWDSDRGEEVGRLQHGGEVDSVTALPASDAVVVVGASKAQIVDVKRRAFVVTIPDVKRLAAVASSAPVAVLRTAADTARVVQPALDASRPRDVPLPSGAEVACTPDGSAFAVAGDTVGVYDARTGATRATIPLKTFRIALDDRGYVYAMAERGIDVFDARGDRVAKLPGTWPFAVSPTGDRVVAAPLGSDLERAALVLDPTTGEVRATLARPPGGLGPSQITIAADSQHVTIMTGGMPSRGRASLALLYAVARSGPPIDSAEIWDENELWASSVHDRRLVAVASSRAEYVGKNNQMVFQHRGATRKLESQSSPVAKVAITSAGVVVDGRGDGRVTAWDLATLGGRGGFDLRGQQKSGVTALAISKDGRRAAIGGAMRIHEMYYHLRDSGDDPDKSKYAIAPLRIVDLQTGRTLVDRWLDSWGFHDIALSPDGERVLTKGWIATASELEAGSFSPRKLPERSEAPGGERLSALAFLGPDRALVDGDVVDLGAMKVVGRAVPSDCPEAELVDVARDGAVALVRCKEEVRLWNVEGRATRRIPAPGPVTAAALGVDGRVAAVAGPGFAAVVDVVTGNGKPIGAVRLSGVTPSAAAVSVSGSHLVLARSDGTEVVVNVATGAAVTRFGANNDWVAYTEDGFFDASATADTSVLAAVDGGVAFQIHQVAIFANRPDILLERIGLAPPVVIDHYRARVARRQTRAGLTEAQLRSMLMRAPTVSVTNVEEDGRTAIVTFEASDGAVDLARFDVAVNGAAVDLSEPTLTGRRARRTVEVPLLAGKNQITVSVTNRAGLESPRVDREVVLGGWSLGELYYLGLGVSKYKASKNDLAYADRDVRELGRALEAATGAQGFAKVHGRVLTNAEVTVDAVRALRDFAAKAKPADTVVVFAAGHGVHARDKEAAYYFATHEVDVRDLARTAARFDLLEDVLAASPARKKLLLLDTCESGDLDASAPGGPLTGAAAGLRARTARDLVVVDDRGRAPEARRPTFDRNRFVYVDLARRSGAVVLGSSRGDEASYELDSLRHGAFTGALLQALTTKERPSAGPGCLGVDDLARRVEIRVAELTGGRQHPALERVNAAAGVCLPFVGE